MSFCIEVVAQITQQGKYCKNQNYLQCSDVTREVIIIWVSIKAETHVAALRKWN